MLELLVQTLNRGQRYAAFVDHTNRTFICSKSERSTEILGHRSKMRGGGIGLVIPLGEWKLGDFFEHAARVDRFKVFFYIAVTGARDSVVGADTAAGDDISHDVQLLCWVVGANPDISIGADQQPRATAGPAIDDLKGGIG